MANSPGIPSLNYISWDGTNLAFSASGDDGGSPITNWKVYRSATQPPGLLQSTNTAGDTLSYTDTSPPLPAYYQVVAINSAGQSQRSNTLFIQDLGITTDWFVQSSAHNPTTVFETGFTYDETRQQNILFGGFFSSTDAWLSETWAWDGNDWSELNPAHSPPGRASHCLAYYPSSSDSILFGGSSNFESTIFNDTWSWNGNDWTQLIPAHSPSARYNFGLAYHGASGKLVLFGGVDPNIGYVADTWTWNGTDWHAEAPATAPSRRGSQSMWFDESTGLVYILGGTDETSAKSDMWSWDGTNWTQVSANALGFRMANSQGGYHVNLAESVLEGGFTYIWKNNFWTNANPLHQPSGTNVLAKDKSGNVILPGTWIYKQAPTVNVTNTDAPGPPLDDPIDSAILLSGDSGTTVGTTVSATNDNPFDPINQGLLGAALGNAQTVWYKFKTHDWQPGISYFRVKIHDISYSVNNQPASTNSLAVMLFKSSPFPPASTADFTDLSDASQASELDVQYGPIYSGSPNHSWFDPTPPYNGYPVPNAPPAPVPSFNWIYIGVGLVAANDPDMPGDNGDQNLNFSLDWEYNTPPTPPTVEFKTTLPLS